MQHCHMCKTTLKAYKFLSKCQLCHLGGRHMAECRPMVWFLRLKIIIFTLQTLPEEYVISPYKIWHILL